MTLKTLKEETFHLFIDPADSEKPCPTCCDGEGYGPRLIRFSYFTTRGKQRHAYRCPKCNFRRKSVRDLEDKL